MVVVVVRFEETTAGGGEVVVVLCDATPLLSRYVVPVELVVVPSAPTDFCVVVVLNTSGSGATGVGVVVVVVDDVDDCAIAGPAIMPSAAMPASKILVMMQSPETQLLRHVSQPVRLNWVRGYDHDRVGIGTYILVAGVVRDRVAQTGAA